ncbi:MAG: TIGR00269 family protein [Candidatus Bathyarchaeota archaeon]|nr:MAG: TIGR00269 family protein [Candidatus Bathyarchaeota archaeon]
MSSTCTICKHRDAIYTRPYSGEKLCNRCFCGSIENKVRATISNFEMFRFDDVIAVGVSGGKDSMALLHILTKLEKSYPMAELTAVTIDEGIHGYRDEALRITKESCRKLGVEHVTLSFKQLFGCELDELTQILLEKTNGAGLTPCAYCGVLRRRALNSVAREYGATKLATAHNLDDETQTVLLNILHGDPLRMVRSRPISSSRRAGFVCRTKPLCEVLEREVALYAYLKNVEFQSVPCPYASRALRNDVRVMLNRMEEKHPGLKYTVYRSAEKLRESLKDYVSLESLGKCKHCGELTVNETCQECELLKTLDT